MMPERAPLAKEERRLRRAERRDKQGEYRRASKMHLARVEHDKSATFSAAHTRERKNRQHFIGWLGYTDVIDRNFASTATL